jgi:hypothetical protein
MLYGIQIQAHGWPRNKSHGFTLEVGQYIRDVLQPVGVPHFDNHPLATRPVHMDDNARPHRSRAVSAYLQSKAVTSVPWRPKYALWDSNPGSWLAKEQKSRLCFGGRRSLLLNDEAWRCHQRRVIDEHVWHGV